MMIAWHAVVSLWLLHINGAAANDWHYVCMMYWTYPAIICLSPDCIYYVKGSLEAPGEPMA